MSKIEYFEINPLIAHNDNNLVFIGIFMCFKSWNAMISSHLRIYVVNRVGKSRRGICRLLERRMDFLISSNFSGLEYCNLWQIFC